MKQFFYAEESPYMPGKWIIRQNLDLLNIHRVTGSCNIIKARLFNLSFADYLRMCRDIYGAQLVGKNSLYVVDYYNGETEKLKMLVKELNNRANSIISRKQCI